MKVRAAAIWLWMMSGGAVCWLCSPQAIPAQDAASVKNQEGVSGKPEPERGYAAFYNASLKGRRTACGGNYAPEKFTAAHRKFHCGTKLRVTNLRNGKTVRVTVTDHGPRSADRIIDLSYAAARSLDFIKQGTTLVKVEVAR